MWFRFFFFYMNQIRKVIPKLSGTECWAKLFIGKKSGGDKDVYVGGGREGVCVTP